MVIFVLTGVWKPRQGEAQEPEWQDKIHAGLITRIDLHVQLIVTYRSLFHSYQGLDVAVLSQKAHYMNSFKFSTGVCCETMKISPIIRVFD
jgi:hypothetical protein